MAYWLIDSEKPCGGMWRMPKEKSLDVLVYILVDDIDETLEKVVKLGGKVVATNRGKEKTSWQQSQTLTETCSDFINTKSDQALCATTSV
jgi:predicted enzyme related to lactoylglutathione lyase